MRPGHAALESVLRAPSLYDEFLAYPRAGPPGHRDDHLRDWSQPHVLDPRLVGVFERIYGDTGRYWREYTLSGRTWSTLGPQFSCGASATYARCSGSSASKPGTGGSSGVAFPQGAGAELLPELFEVPGTAIGPGWRLRRSAGPETAPAASQQLVLNARRV